MRGRVFGAIWHGRRHATVGDRQAKGKLRCGRTHWTYSPVGRPGPIVGGKNSRKTAGATAIRPASTTRTTKSSRENRKRRISPIKTRRPWPQFASAALQSGRTNDAAGSRNRYWMVGILRGFINRVSHGQWRRGLLRVGLAEKREQTDPADERDLRISLGEYQHCVRRNSTSRGRTTIAERIRRGSRLLACGVLIMGDASILCCRSCEHSYRRVRPGVHTVGSEASPSFGAGEPIIAGFSPNVRCRIKGSFHSSTRRP